MKRIAWIAAVALLATACGADQNLVDPRLIAGGGLGDGAIAGRVNVYVIDGDTDQPISGADVYVGEPGGDPFQGVTDSSGLYAVDDGSLDGPTTITVAADGYPAQTWFGANGANVTIPLSSGATGNVPQATLTGTIAGWDSLPAPQTNHVTIGVVSYSQSRNLGDPENNIQQPSVGQLPANACTKSALGSMCDWSLISRTGKVALFAIILDLDTKGTASGTDDTTTVIGFAFKRGVTVEDGVTQSGLSLTMLDVTAQTDVNVTSDTPPSGLSNDTGVIMGLDLGDEGIAMVSILQDSSAGTVTVPALSGLFDGASYQAIAFAQMGTADGDPLTGIIQRDLTDLAGGIDLGPWLPLPSGLAEAGGEYSFTPVDGAALHTFSMRDNGTEAWGGALLDGRTSFTLPGISPDPLPSAYDLQVSAFDGPLDVESFQIDDFTQTFVRTSDNKVSIGQ